MLLVAGNIDPGNQWDDRNWFTVIGSECLFGQFGELSKDCFNLSSDFLTFLLDFSVLGEKIGKTAQQNEDQQREVVVRSFFVGHMVELQSDYLDSNVTRVLVCRNLAL